MTNKPLQSLHHVAISVSDISRAIDWYSTHFECELKYQDLTWALLKFANIHLALVLPEEHPPHIALVTDKAEDFGPLILHRDGTKSIYIQDSEGNHIELMQG